MGKEPTRLMNIGFIGLGRMGSAMAARLIGASFSVSVFDTDSKKIAGLAAIGAKVCNDIASLASTCDLVITMLPNDEILRAVTIGSQGISAHLGAGAIHMVSGTHGVGVMRELHSAHQNSEQIFIACHVLGRPDLAAVGKLGLVSAGPVTALENLAPIFAVLGDKIFNAGVNPISATAIKIANNFMLGCAIEAIGEGMALVRKYSVDPLLFHQVLVGGLFNSTAYSAYGDLIAKEDWSRIGATAIIGLKDAELTLEAANAVSVQLPTVTIWKAHLEKAIARGEENLDWSVMAREQFRESGLE